MTCNRRLIRPEWSKLQAEDGISGSGGTRSQFQFSPVLQLGICDILSLMKFNFVSEPDSGDYLLGEEVINCVNQFLPRILKNMIDRIFFFFF